MVGGDTELASHDEDREEFLMKVVLDACLRAENDDGQPWNKAEA
jgi:hypothetical protein